MKETIKIQGQLKLFLSWPLLLSLFLIFGNLAVAALSMRSGLLLLPFTLCYLIAAVVICLHQKKRILSGLVEFSAQYAWIQKQLLVEMAVPYGLADEDGSLLWANEAFREILSEKKALKKNLVSLFPEMTRTDLGTDDIAHIHTTYQNRKFRVDVRPV